MIVTGIHDRDAGRETGARGDLGAEAAGDRGGRREPRQAVAPDAGGSERRLRPVARRPIGEAAARGERGPGHGGAGETQRYIVGDVQPEAHAARQGGVGIVQPGQPVHGIDVVVDHAGAIVPGGGRKAEPVAASNGAPVVPSGAGGHPPSPGIEPDIALADADDAERGDAARIHRRRHFGERGDKVAVDGIEVELRGAGRGAVHHHRAPGDGDHAPARLDGRDLEVGRADIDAEKERAGHGSQAC